MTPFERLRSGGAINSKLIAQACYLTACSRTAGYNVHVGEVAALSKVRPFIFSELTALLTNRRWTDAIMMLLRDLGNLD